MVHSEWLQQLQGYRRTGLGIRKGVMVIHEVIAARSGDGLKLMVWQLISEVMSGYSKGVVELIVGVVHLIDPEHRLQATFVKAGVVSNQRESLDERLYLLPHMWEHRSIIGILRPQTVDLLAEPLVVFRFRVNKAVERVHNLSVTYYHYADGADAGRLFVRRLEIYCCKVSHFFLYNLFMAVAMSAISLRRLSGASTSTSAP